MKITVKESTTVIPAEKTPREKLWLSNPDLIAPNYHASSVYFYRPDGSSASFFDTKVMQDALSMALVAFYPVAGRYKKDENGRTEIDCQGQGVLFVEAQADGVVDDYGDFRPSLELWKLVPAVDYSQGIEAFPLFVSQVTYFKCGGVSLGTGIHHGFVDGISALHFINTWSDMARGIGITLSPLLDRTLLHARDPPQPIFEHIEYEPTSIPLTLEAPSDEALISVFKITRDQLDILKGKSKIKYSSFEILAGHVWKCACKARGPFDDTKTKLFITTNGRDRLQPALPRGYFGNAIFRTSPIAISCEIQSNPSWYAASIIHTALSKVNNDHLRSLLDYLELVPDRKALVRGPHTLKSPNLAMTAWTKIPIYDADFGWGRPVYMGPAWIPYEGCSFMLPSPINDGSMSIVISLQPEHMKRFSKFFYDDI